MRIKITVRSTLSIALAFAGFAALLPAEEPKEHWAFLPLSKAEGNIDSFVEEKLRAEGLSFSPKAERRALLRRLSFGLTGLPPSWEEMDAFVKDPRGDDVVFSEAVERLLESPHYGERWGRVWLDVARYADSNGQDENKAMSHAWRYRDWVVEAFQKDLPFDDFVKLQVAGDLYGNSSHELTPTGFLGIGPKRLAEQDKAKMVHDIVDEQIDTMGRAFLGLTLGCARCHDHKFDPFSQVEYTALASIFQSTKTMADTAHVSKWQERDISSEKDQLARKKHVEDTKQLSESLAKAEKAAREEVVTRIQSNLLRYYAAGLREEKGDGLIPELVKRWQLIPPDDRRRLGAIDRKKLPELASLSSTAKGLVPGKVGGALRGGKGKHVDVAHRDDLEPDHFTLECWVLMEEASKQEDTRRWIVNKNGNEWERGHYALVVRGGQAIAYLASEGGQGKQVTLASGEELLKEGGWHHLATTFDGEKVRLFVDGKLADEAEFKKARQKGRGNLRIGGRADGYSDASGLRIDEVRLHSRAFSADEVQVFAKSPQSFDDKNLIQRWSFDPEGAEEAEALQYGGLLAILEERKLTGVDLVAEEKNWSESQRKEMLRLRDAQEALAKNPPPAQMQVIAVSKASVKRLRLMDRGDHTQPVGEPVALQLPTRLGGQATPIAAESTGRRELAEWMASPEQPLTARVFVNRGWQVHFGEGLVRTPDNFGPTGQAPTHPELLDWLAREFVESGWSVKHLHRLILSSRTWQQRSLLSEEGLAKDPDHRFLWRYPPRRLEAEMIRDSLLAVSGLLEREVGGSLASFKNHDYVKGDIHLADSNRRAIYLPVIRDRMHPALALFDFPTPSASSSRRDETTVPLQALFFLNSPVATRSGEALAASLPEAESIQAAYRKVLGRDASSEEVERGEAFLKSYPESEKAMAAFCGALLSSNEFLFVD